jgi:hypothetical protein
MPSLDLHIGCEKTGTTSVQRFLRANRELLSQAGILFPRAPGEENQMGLAVAAQSEFGPLRRKIFKVRSWPEVEAFREKLKHDLEQELSAAAYRRAVMSGEHCSSRLIHPDEVEWLRDFLRQFFDDITVIVYIRRQDDFLLSTYSTDVKGGAQHRLRIPEEDLLRRRYDYWELLDRWSAAFGRQKVVCRKYETSALIGGDIVQDFIATARLDADLSYSFPRRLNESLDADCLEFLRLFNQHIPRLTNEGVNKARGNIVSMLVAASNGPLLTLPEDLLREFMARLNDSNRKVAEEYFGGANEESDDPLFARSADSRPRTTAPEMTVEKAIHLCASIWEKKQEQLDEKQKHIEGLTARVARLRQERGKGVPPRLRQKLQKQMSGR